MNKFPTVSQTPVEVTIGKHESKAVIRPMTSEEFYPLMDKDKVLAMQTDGMAPKDMAELIADNVISLEGHDCEITAEFLTSLYYVDLLHLFSSVTKVSKYTDDQLKNSDSPSETLSSVAANTENSAE